METNTRLSGTFFFFGRVSRSILLISLHIRHPRASSIFHKSTYSVWLFVSPMHSVSLCFVSLFRDRIHTHIYNLASSGGHAIKYFHSYLLTENLHLLSIVIPQIRQARQPQRASPLRHHQGPLLSKITSRFRLVLKRTLTFKNTVVWSKKNFVIH
jgi:hypothetical protein